METAQHWDRLPKNQPAEITMFQISEVQESPAFYGRRSFLALRRLFKFEPALILTAWWKPEGVRVDSENPGQLFGIDRHMLNSGFNGLDFLP